MADAPKSVNDTYTTAFNKRDDGTVVEMRLHQIDAFGAVRRFPHQWAWTADGFAKKAPPKSNEIDLNTVIGQTGGNPAMAGGVGVVGVVPPGASAATEASAT